MDKWVLTDADGNEVSAAAEVSVSEWAAQTPEWGTEDYRRKAALFNDITRAPIEYLPFSDRNKLADYLWQQGWRRDVRPEDVTER